MDKEKFAAMIADKQDNPNIHELAKKFPEKTYRELEQYRDADRLEEAQQTPLSESQKSQKDLEPIEGEEQDNPTLWELAKKHNISYADAVPIQEDLRLKKDALKEACILGEMRKDRTPLANMKKRAQEAEGELSIMKQLETNRVKEAQAHSSQLQDELDRIKKENNDSFNRIAELIEIEESHQRLNGKLQVRIAELEDENNQMRKHLDKQLEAARKAGL